MSRILPILLLLILQACQVSEEVASAKQIPQHVSNPQFTVVVSNDGWKKLSDSIQVSLQFPFNVNVSGSPYINVTIGSYVKRFYYYSGTGSQFIVFKYTVTSLDKDTDGVEFTNSIELNGGSLTYLDSQQATYATTNVINVPASEIKVDGIVPTISPHVQYATDRYINYYSGWKNPGDSIDIKMNYPYAILVAGSPFINVIVGSVSRKFSYYSGTGTGAITYRYTLTSADVNVDKIAIASEVTLNSATMNYLDVYGAYKPAATSLNYTGLQVQIDGAVPTPYSITPPINGIYATNDDLKYIVDFSEKVYVTGTPGFSVVFDFGGGLATYASGSGTQSLNFKRKILVGDSDVNGYSTGGVLNLNSLTGIEIKDEAGNSVSTAFPIISSNIMINVTGPTILSVSPPANATYTLGQNLDFTVVMSEAVNVTGTPSIPITLTTGNVAATLYSNPTPSTLVFRYTVVANQQDLNGITLTSPITLNGGTIKNLALTKPALLTYTVPSTASIAVNSVVGPYIIAATVPTSGTYIEGQNLDFSLRFNVPVSVNIAGGTPRIGINLGAGVVYANYQPALSSNTLMVFRYTATIGDNDMDGLSVASPLLLNGGIIQDAGLLNANLAFSTPDASAVKVDAVKPTIASVSAPLAGNYHYNQTMYLSVSMSESVTVTGTPQIALDIGGTLVNASYHSGSGSALLTFKYDIQLNRLDTNGIDLITPLNLNGGTIVDAKGHSLTVLAFSVPASTGVLVDALPPSILSVTPPAAATYAVGNNIDFIVNWSENVSLAGTPHIVLDVGGTPVLAKYIPTLSSSSSTFRYTVLTGHSDIDDISIPSPTIVLYSGSIKDVSANDASLGFALPSLAGVLVNGSAPSILSVTTPTPVTHKVGSVITFTVTWSEAVNITGFPKLKITIGATDVLAAYAGGTGTTVTTFTYTVLPNQNDIDGIALNTIVHLDSGTIKDLSNNVASLVFAAPNLGNVNVDGIAPAIVLLEPPANENYQNLQNLDFKITWDEKVVVTGSPRIALDVNCVVGPCPTLYANYLAAGSTNTMKIFRYTVGTNDVDTNGIGILPAFPLVPTIDLNGGSLQDIATNNAAVTFPRPILTGVLVDGATPYIVSVTPPANGLYGSGMDLNVTIKWSEIVNVDTNLGLNKPYVFIKVGSANRQAFYSSGTGTTDIVFTYTLIAGESDTNGIDVLSAVNLNTSGTIKDGAGNDVYRTFTNTNYPLVKVDAVLPYVVSATSTNITGGASKNNYFSPSHTIQYNVTFSEAVTWSVSPTIVVDIGGNFRVATYFGGTGTTVLTFRIILDAGDVLLDLDGISVAATIGGTIRDVALNTFAGALPFTEKDYVYYANMIARYHVADYLADYTTASCFPFTCIATVKDITGNGHNIAPTGTAPIVASNFGTQLTKAMDFSNLSTMRFPSTMSIKYAIFAMKNVSTASTSATTSTHTMLNSWNPTGTTTHFVPFGGAGPHTHGDDPTTYWGGSHSYLTFGYTPLIQYQSNASTKIINMSPTQKLKIDGAAFPGAYVSSESGPALWTASDTTIYIHEFSAPEVTFQGTLLGGGNFTGQIAEAIFFTSTANITEAKLEEIRDQLNAIHGAY